MARVYDTDGNEATELRPLLIRMTSDLDQALRERAAAEDRGLAQVVRQALKAYLSGSSPSPMVPGRTSS